MKKYLIMVAATVISMNAYSTAFECKSELNQIVKVKGNLSLESASVQINDEKDSLGIRELNSEVVIEMNRSIRKKEANYKFAKYYSDFSAFQDLEISVPKSLKSKKFKAFLTVYGDDGDSMVPGEAITLLCSLK